VLDSMLRRLAPAGGALCASSAVLQCTWEWMESTMLFKLQLQYFWLLMLGCIIYESHHRSVALFLGYVAG
jgi:hypothetical protein